MMICNKCGMLFTDGDECPSCGSLDVCESDECIICGKTVREGQLLNGVCVECARKGSTIENALLIGKKYPDHIEVNSFVSYFLGEERINEILMNAVTKSEHETLVADAKRYCFDDPDSLTTFLADKHDDPDGAVRVHRRNIKRRD